jgi:hypothetical protein
MPRLPEGQQFGTHRASRPPGRQTRCWSGERTPAALAYPAAPGQAARQPVVVGQAVDMVVQRVTAGGRQHAGLAHAAARHLADAVGAGDQFARAAQGRTDRRAQALAEAHRHAVEMAGDAPAGSAQCPKPHATAALNRRAPSRWVASPRARQRGRLLHVGQRQHLPPRCSPAPAAGARKVASSGLMAAAMSASAMRAVGLRQRLRLDAAQHRSAAALVAVGVGQLADDVLVATPQCAISAHRLLCVPVGMKSAASKPSRAAMRSCSALTLGSSPNTSSPTSAAAMAARMAACRLGHGVAAQVDQFSGHGL